MATYFSAICAAEGIQLPANDVDARTFLSGAGASFSRKPGAPRVAERLEGSAAVAWARAHIADDAAWVAIPDPAADILRTLYPLKASIVSLGGTAWVLPFRSLVQGQITPVSSPAKIAAAAAGPNLRNRAPGAAPGGGPVRKDLGAALNAAANQPNPAAAVGAPPPNPAAGAVNQQNPLSAARAAPAPPPANPAQTDLAAALVAALTAFAAAPPVQPAVPEPTTGLPAALAAAIAAFVRPAAPSNQPPVPGWSDVRAPYLPAPALEAILDTARLTQLYLGEAWTLEKRAIRDKHLARMNTSTQFDKRFEDPADPMWSQRLAFRRGPGSSFSPEEVNRDGKNVALALRWESRALHQTRGNWPALRRMDERATLVREAWSRIMQGVSSQQGVPQAIISPILLTIQEILDSRAAEAMTELGLLGPAGNEISTDMIRQKVEIHALFKAYNEHMAALLTEGNSLQDVARQTNGIWYALLHPAMLYICTGRGLVPERDPLITQAETAGAAQSPPTPNLGKRAGGSGSAEPKTPTTVVIPDPPVPQTTAPLPWFHWGPPPASMVSPLSATVQVPLPPPPYPPPFSPAPPPYMPPSTATNPSTPQPPPTPPTPPTLQPNTKFCGRPTSRAVVGDSRGNPKDLPVRALCTSCKFHRKHGRHEYPLRFFKRYGFAMPGFLPLDPESYDPSAWVGQDITPATAVAWRSLLASHPEMVNPMGSNFTANLA